MKEDYTTKIGNSHYLTGRINFLNLGVKELD